jgi:uncharacterized protein (DUF2336 family)
MIVHRFLNWIDTAPEGRRAEAAHALARAYLHCDVDADTLGAMEAAVTLLLDDPSPSVRFALADALATSPDAPRHVILALAADQMEIAERVLARSPVFIDAELVDVVASAVEPLQMAVASRPAVSPAVAAAIAEVGDIAACLRLIFNEGARIARISFRRMAERFGDTPEMRDALFERADLPAEVHQLLVRQLGDALGNLVVIRNWIPQERAAMLTREACDRATVAIAAETARDDLAALAEHLRITGQLTTALLLRTLCAGNIAFFAAALANLSGVPGDRAAAIVKTGRAGALAALYGKASLPKSAHEALTAAVEACRTVESDGGPADRYRFSRYMVDNVLARYAEITDGELNELMTMLRRFAADQARDAARSYAATIAAA